MPSASDIQRLDVERKFVLLERRYVKYMKWLLDRMLGYFIFITSRSFVHYLYANLSWVFAPSRASLDYYSKETRLGAKTQLRLAYW